MAGIGVEFATYDPTLGFTADAGTWTPLASNVLAVGDTMGRDQASLSSLAGSDFQTLPPEVDAVVKLFSRGWKSSYWDTCVLLEFMLKTLRSKGVPRSGDRR